MTVLALNHFYWAWTLTCLQVVTVFLIQISKLILKKKNRWMSYRWEFGPLATIMWYYGWSYQECWASLHKKKIHMLLTLQHICSMDQVSFIVFLIPFIYVLHRVIANSYPWLDWILLFFSVVLSALHSCNVIISCLIGNISAWIENLF